MPEDTAGCAIAGSPAVETFLAGRRAGVLTRAIHTLATCPLGSVAAEAHRLSGTLGVFGLEDSAALVRELESLALASGTTAHGLSHQRAVTVVRLEAAARATDAAPR